MSASSPIQTGTYTAAESQQNTEESLDTIDITTDNNGNRKVADYTHPLIGNDSSGTVNTRRVTYNDVAVKVNGKQAQVKNVPMGYQVVHKVQFRKMVNAKKDLDVLKKSLDRQKFCGGKLANRIYGAAMSIAPGLSLTAAEALIPMIVVAFIADLDEGLC